ncbi:MAG: hypothetical protein V3U54_12920 [Thermodesulfobacteriota bacterium]
MEVVLHKVSYEPEKVEKSVIEKTLEEFDRIYPPLASEDQFIKKYCAVHNHFTFQRHPYMDERLKKRLTTATGQSIIFVKSVPASTPSGWLPTYDGFSGYLFRKGRRGGVTKFNNGSLQTNKISIEDSFANQHKNIIARTAKEVFGPLKSNVKYISMEKGGQMERTLKLETLKGDRHVRTYKKLNDAVKNSRAGLKSPVLGEPNIQKFEDLVNTRIAEKQTAITERDSEREAAAAERVRAEMVRQAAEREKLFQRGKKLTEKAKNTVTNMKSQIGSAVSQFETNLRKKQDSLNQAVKDIENNLRDIPELTPMHNQLQRLQVVLLTAKDDILRTRKILASVR